MYHPAYIVGKGCSINVKKILDEYIKSQRRDVLFINVTARLSRKKSLNEIQRTD